MHTCSSTPQFHLCISHPLAPKNMGNKLDKEKEPFHPCTSHPLTPKNMGDKLDKNKGQYFHLHTSHPLAVPPSYAHQGLFQQ
ncbi:hypothetical protein M405DRAFT_870322 [Rhizopogon salebrosus TDB-379]|nr:hypothetical protein M405DRAFT_870322 [Rhizopogon salebrosus TDB-379]